MCSDSCDGAHHQTPRHPTDVTPEWLTLRLRNHGVLLNGKVTSISTQVGETWNVSSLIGKTGTMTLVPITWPI